MGIACKNKSKSIPLFCSQLCMPSLVCWGKDKEGAENSLKYMGVLEMKFMSNNFLPSFVREIAYGTYIGGW